MSHYDRHVSIASSSRSPQTSRIPCYIATLLPCYRLIRTLAGFSFVSQLSGPGILHLRRRTAALSWVFGVGCFFSFCEIPLSHVNIRLDHDAGVAMGCGSWRCENFVVQRLVHLLFVHTISDHSVDFLGECISGCFACMVVAGSEWGLALYRDMVREWDTSHTITISLHQNGISISQTSVSPEVNIMRNLQKCQVSRDEQSHAINHA